MKSEKSKVKGDKKIKPEKLKVKSKKENEIPFHSSPFTFHSLLLARRANVHVYLLCAATAKQASSKNKNYGQDQNHENYQDCDNSSAAASSTIVIVSHSKVLLF